MKPGRKAVKVPTSITAGRVTEIAIDGVGVEVEKGGTESTRSTRENEIERMMTEIANGRSITSTEKKEVPRSESILTKTTVQVLVQGHNQIILRCLVDRLEYNIT
jgi:hypothetical protein